MIKILYRSVLFAVLAGLWGCGTPFTMVSPGPVPVAKKSFTVEPQTAWNRFPKAANEIPQEESWTQNGMLLDTIAFVGALPDGKSLAKQSKKDDKQVPVFRANMTPDDLVTMIESSYRIGGVATFEVANVEPVLFLGQPAVRFDFNYVASDSLPRRGRTVLTVVGERLYMMKLEGAASHYFERALPEFEAMVSKAALR